MCNSLPVWRSLLTKLRDDEAPDLPPHISVDGLSTSELRTIVLGGLRQKLLWDSTSTSMKPSRVDEVLLWDSPSSTAEQAPRIDARLVPGGRHVLVENGSCIQLWSVGTGQLVWSTPLLPDSHACLAFDFEVATGGEGIMIAALFLECETYRRLVVLLANLHLTSTR